MRFRGIQLSQTAVVLLLSAGIYAIYLPIALLLDAQYRNSQRQHPLGTLVHLGYFKLMHDDELTDDIRGKGHFYKTVFRWTLDPGEPSEDGVRDSHILLYENDHSLGSPFIQYLGYSKSYTFWFHTSDGSDPNTNGRDYWLVRR